MLENWITNYDGGRGRNFDLTLDEVRRLCRPGEGADTCIWLVYGQETFTCLYYNRRVPSLTGEILEDRWQKGFTVAKRDGCHEIREK